MWGSGKPAKKTYKDGRGLNQVSLGDAQLKWVLAGLVLLGLLFNR
jgi:hypothetical protein